MPRVDRHRKRIIISYILLILMTAGVIFYVVWLHYSSGYTREHAFSQPEQSFDTVSQQTLEDYFEILEPVEIEGLDPDQPMVALSFDDAVTDITPEYLQVLDEYDCEASFFVVGYLAEKLPDIFRQLAESGMELGNHSYSHQQLVGLSVERAAEQFDSCTILMEGLAGENGAPVLARPPYGRVDDKVLAASQLPVVLYSLDSRDAESSTPEEIVERVMGEVQDGDIILLHDGCPQTVDALPMLIESLQNEGYQITTIGNLFASHGYGLKPGVKYTKCPQLPVGMP